MYQTKAINTTSSKLTDESVPMDAGNQHVGNMIMPKCEGDEEDLP
jgi:hypothetical protein